MQALRYEIIIENVQKSSEKEAKKEEEKEKEDESEKDKNLIADQNIQGLSMISLFSFCFFKIHL